MDGNAALAPEEDDAQPSRIGVKTPNYRKRPDSNVIDVDFSPRSSRRDAAKSGLAEAEQDAAASPVSVLGGGSSEAKAAEQNQSYGPRFTGKGLPNGEQKSKSRGFLKKKGPLVAIMTLLLGGGALMGGAQTLMPFATANRIIQEFNSMQTVMNKRSRSFLRTQLNTERYLSPTRVTIFGNEKFKLTSKQIKNFKTEGIEVMDVEVGGRKVRLLTFDDGSGELQPILTSTDINKVDADELGEALRSANPDLNFKSGAIDIDAAFEVDGFRNGYLKSSQTWRGAIAGWFDSLVLKIFDRLGISRNRFKTWKTASDIEAGNAEFKRAASGDGVDDKGIEGQAKEEVKNKDGVDADGDGEVDTTLEDKTVTEADNDKLSATDSQTEIETKLGNKARALIQAASGLTDVVYVAMTVGTAINSIAVAQEVMQLINYITGYLEAVQKVQAGDGDASPMAYYTNLLTTPDEDGETGMEAQGIGLLFGSGTIDLNDESVKKYNLEGGVTLLGIELNFSAEDMKNAAYMKMMTTSIGAVLDLILLVTGPVGWTASLLKSFLVDVVIDVGVGLILDKILSVLLSVVIPGLAAMLAEDLVSDVLGEDAGNALSSAANIYLAKNHQGSGGSPGDQATVLAYKRETEIILAEEAEYDRATRSPFDVTSQNTFLGSLLYSLMPLAASMQGGFGFWGGLVNLTQSSFAKILPTASALEETQLITQQGECPLLESVGIMGDAYCNPYYTSDLSTIDEDPGEDIYETVAAMNMSCGKGNFKTDWVDSNGDGLAQCDEYVVRVDEEENPVIDLDSNLGKYIVYCGQRDTQFGVADSNIAAAMKMTTGSSTADSILGAGLGAIPVIGDLADVVDVAQDLNNAPWISGSACVASEENDLWGENKYYQRYMEDQRLMEEMGLIKKSSVTTALEEYYEENPLDNSYEGVLARMSGLTKEDVIATLDLVDYMNFLAEYDPTELLPVPVEPAGEVDYDAMTPDGVIADADTVVVPQVVIYADVRNRSFAV